MKEEKRAATSHIRSRPLLQILNASGSGHVLIVNVPPPRVESARPTVTVTSDTVCAYRSTSVDPRSPISGVLFVISPFDCSALNFATSTFTVTDRLVRSNAPKSAGPMTCSDEATLVLSC